MPKKQFFLQRAGFSLVEVMIAIGIFAFTSLIIGSLIVSSTSQSIQIQRKLTIQQQFENIESVLKRYLRQAVDLRYCAAIPGAIATGCLREYDSTTASNDVATIAVFGREVAARPVSTINPPNRAASTVITSVFRPTGIFFLPPPTSVANGYPNKSGVLFIDPSQVGSDVVSPDYSDVMIPGLISFKVDSLNYQVGTNSMKSAQFTIVLREFLPSTGPGLHRRIFCPAPCDTGDNLPYRDLTRTFSVVFRNNALGADPLNPTQITRPLGLIYFFDMKRVDP